MKQIFLIIAKDFRRYRILLLCMMLAFGVYCYLLQSVVSPYDIVAIPWQANLFSGLIYYVFWFALALAYIPAVIQEDSPRSDNALLQTKPVSRMQVLTAKLINLCLIGMVVPILFESVILVRAGVSSSDLLKMTLVRVLFGGAFVFLCAMLAAQVRSIESYLISLVIGSLLLLLVSMLNAIITAFGVDNSSLVSDSALITNGMLLSITSLLALRFLYKRRYRAPFFAPVLVFLVYLTGIVSLPVIFPKRDTALSFANEVAEAETPIVFATIFLPANSKSNQKALQHQVAHIEFEPRGEEYFVLRSGVVTSQKDEFAIIPRETSENNFVNHTFGKKRRNEHVDTEQMLSLLVSGALSPRYSVLLPDTFDVGASTPGAGEQKGVGSFDVFRVEKLFEIENRPEQLFSENARRTWLTGVRSDWRSGIRLLERTLQPLFDRGLERTLSQEQHSPADVILRNAAEGGDGLLVVFELLDEENQLVIDPLYTDVSQEWGYPLFPKSLVEKRYWKSPLRINEVDLFVDDISKKPSTFVGLRISYVGARDATIEIRSVRKANFAEADT